MSVMTSDKTEAKAALRKALEGCRSCEYDEADGALYNHCDDCCRKVTAAAWDWWHASPRLRAIATPVEGVKPRASKHSQ